MYQSNKSKLFYGWIILAIATLALIITNGLTIGGIPVFYKWIREEFVTSGAVDATRAESFIAFGATLTFLLAGASAPFAGWLIQRFPLRRLMIWGCFILGIALLIHSQAASPTTVYLARILMGISLSFVGVLANVLLVSNWFVRKRGIALGILLTGTSFGGFLIPQITNPLIQSYGWRTAMILVSLINWTILLPAVIFLVKNLPSDLGLFPDGDVPDTNEKNEVKEITGLTLSEAVKTPVFWIFALSSALIFYPIFVISQQFILYLQTPKIGLDAQQGAFALSMLFLSTVVGKSLFGFLSDIMSPTLVITMCCAVMFFSSLILLSLNASNAYFFLLPFGTGYGGTFVLIQRLVADYFGNRDYPKILGVIVVVETTGGAVGGILTGRLADLAGGDYTEPFYLVIGVTAFALLLTIMLNLIVGKKMSI